MADATVVVVDQWCLGIGLRELEGIGGVNDERKGEIGKGWVINFKH